MTMSSLQPPPMTTDTAAAAAAAAADADADDAGRDSTTAVTDASAAGAESKAMMEYFRKRCKSGEVASNLLTAAVNTGDTSVAQAAAVSDTSDTDFKSVAGDRMTIDVHKEYGYYHTVSSSDARVLRAALAKERVPIFRRSDSKARRSAAGVSMRFARERITEGEITQTDGQSFSPARSDSKSFRDIFLRRRNRSDQRSEPNADISTETKPKSGRMRIRNFLVSFRSRPRSVSVSYAPVDVASSSSMSGSATASVQTFGKKKKFKVTPATLLPGLKRPETPRVGPEDFVEMYCRSRTTSDPRSDAILKARVAASLHKVKYTPTHMMSNSVQGSLVP